MNTWVAPGVRCICVNDDWTEFTARGQVFPIRQPMIDEVLTIRDVQPGRGGGDGKPMHVYLGFWEIDIVQESGAVFASIHWIVTHFRPLQELSTDISELTALLEPAPGEREPTAPESQL